VYYETIFAVAKITQLCSSALNCVWNDGGMILRGRNWSTGRKTLYSVGDSWLNENGAMVELY